MSLTDLHSEAGDVLHGGGSRATVEVGREGLVGEEASQIGGGKLAGLAIGEEQEDKSSFVVGGELATKMELQLLVLGLEHLVGRVLVLLEDLEVDELAFRAVISVLLDGLEQL